MIKGFPTNNRGKWEWITKFWNMNFPAHGGVIGTSRELAKFLQDQLKEKSSILSPATKKLFYSPQYFNNGSAINSALGWRMQTMENGKRMYAHGGGGLAYRLILHYTLTMVSPGSYYLTVPDWWTGVPLKSFPAYTYPKNNSPPCHRPILLVSIIPFVHDIGSLHSRQ